MTAAQRFKEALAAEQPLQIAGAINAYSAMLAEHSGFRAIYLSGGGVANWSYGLPDLGMTTMNDVLEDVRRITYATDVPLLVDIDTGWGSAFNIARTIKLFEGAGAACVHIEDQVAAKRCGHRPGKEIISQDEMVERVTAAADARDDMLIMARTDALAVEGLDSAVERAAACIEAGADFIFAEAMTDLAMYKRFTDLGVPVLANITEFGTTDLYTTEELAGQFLGGVEIGGAEFGDVGQHRDAEVGEALVHRQIRHRLGEDEVRAGLDAGRRAFDRRVQTLDGERVGAGHDQHVVAGVGGRGHALDHLVLADDLLARPVAAALGRDLVLDVHAGRAGALEQLDRARDVEGAAPAGVDVDQQRHVGGVGDPAHVLEDVVHRGHAQIGQAVGPVGHAAAGQIDRPEAAVLGEHGGIGVDRTGDLERLFGGERLLEALGCGHRRILSCRTGGRGAGSGATGARGRFGLIPYPISSCT